MVMGLSVDRACQKVEPFQRLLRSNIKVLSLVLTILAYIKYTDSPICKMSVNNFRLQVGVENDETRAL